jgi:hypothetical protein
VPEILCTLTPLPHGHQSLVNVPVWPAPDAKGPGGRFASACCCGAAAAIAAGRWEARSVPAERRAAWAAWRAACVRSPALQAGAMQSVLEAARA